MKFKFFQALGCVVFNKSYFLELQANSIKSYNKLEDDYKVLKNSKDDTELLKRIDTLQLMLREERLENSKIVSELQSKIKSQNSKINNMDVTIKSSNYLIKDLWDFINKFGLRKAERSLTRCEKDLKECNEKVSEVREITKEAQKLIRPDKKVEVKAVNVTDKIFSVDTYA